MLTLLELHLDSIICANLCSGQSLELSFPGRGFESQQLRLKIVRWKICCTVVIAMHEAGGSVEEGRDRGLRPDMEFQLSPLTQMLGWNRQSVSILATPSRTLNLQLLARPQDLSLFISPCVSSTWSRGPFVFCFFFKKITKKHHLN